ncbi:hypothetical protein HYDPIDRAFT_120456 [Hydnomerulius pinastri MD-312]|uniref:DUF6533 domain-containing protein n=1 Tax=Hydnomerulius pinastri MD-312 TaxID=994086 RepID=A0A0C9W6F8_9AGAM|nr:hypothetical protein HYDPIDRAFT_120456 [Hydnomerulius pinastri MD-312]
MDILFDDARDLRIVTVPSISIIFVFDYLYQLEDELTFIWNRRDWGLGKGLFVSTRYIPFAVIPMTLYSSLSNHLSTDSCTKLFYCSTVISAIAITLSEFIFSLRTYAMWNRNRIILAITCCTLTASVTAVTVIFISFLPSVKFGDPPLPVISGCYKTGASSVLFASLIIFLTMYRAHRHFRHAQNQLIKSLTYDGVFYCLCMFGVYQVVMHTILATRMQLHLRKIDRHIYVSGQLSEESLLPMSFNQLDLFDEEQA